MGDQKAADAVACHEGKLALEEVQAAEGCELIEHQQQLLPAPIGIQALGQPPSDLVEDEAHQRALSGHIGGRYYQVQRHRSNSLDQITDAPVAPPRHFGNDGITIESQETHGRRQHA